MLTHPHGITPPEGARAFVKKFGSRKHLISAAASMGLRISTAAITHWCENDSIPDHIYSALRTIMVEDNLSIALGGHIEFYVSGQSIGKFYLHKDVSAVIRKQRKK